MNVEASALGPVLSRGSHRFECLARSKTDYFKRIELITDNSVT